MGFGDIGEKIVPTEVIKEKDKIVPKAKQEATKKKKVYSEQEKKWIKMGILKTDEEMEIDVIKTGSVSLDYALGGGLWRGKFHQVLGYSGSGKSTLCLHFAKEIQKEGGKVMYIDMENTLNKQRVEDTGVNYDAMMIVTPEDGNAAVDLIQEAITSKEYSMIIWDGIDSSIPKKILHADSGESHMGVNGRMISEAMRKFAASLRGTDVTLVATNQYRIDLNSSYGDGWTTPGGPSPYFYSSQIIKLSKINKADSQIKDNSGKKIGTFIRCRIEKNKIGEPDRVAEFYLMYNGSIKEGKFTIPKFVEVGILTREGNTFFKGGEKIGTQAKLVEYYASNLDMYYSDCEKFVEGGMAKNQKREPIDNNPF